MDTGSIDETVQMTNLNDLQFFVVVAHAGSFTRAADQLGVPKSAVSRAISRLEKRLSVLLLQRTTRRVVVTEAGALYLNHAERAIAEAEQADSAATNSQTSTKGDLRIGMPTPFAKDFVAPLLPDFLREYPDLRVHLALSGSSAIYAAPFQDLDLVIKVGGEVEDSSLFVKVLGRIGRAIYASPQYLQKFGTPTAPLDLKSHACITVSERCPWSTWHLFSGPKVVDVEVDPRLSVNEPTIVCQLAMEGFGIAIVDDWRIPALPQGALVRLLPGWQAEPVPVYALYPLRLGLTKKVRAFVEFLDTRLSPRLSQVRQLATDQFTEPGLNLRIKDHLLGISARQPAGAVAPATRTGYAAVHRGKTAV